MKDNRLYTPEGTADLLISACNSSKELQDKFLDSFKSYGYDIVEPPMFEYIDVFTDKNKNTDLTSMIKFFDANGDILAMRPDFTPAIARMSATKFADKSILKLGYTGKAFLNSEAYSNVRQKEFIQAGVEFMGEGGTQADSEIIALTIDALLKSGLKSFQIEIGHAGFFKGIVMQAGLDNDAEDELRDILNRKDFISIQSFLNEHNVDSALAEIISKLPYLFGDISVVEKVHTDGLNDLSKQALAELKEIYTILCEYELEKYISFDLGLAQSFDYYTGMIFKGFAHHVGFPICGGGRYDNLIKRFGKNMPSTGVALWVDRILAALERSGAEFETPVADYLISYEKGYRKEAISLAKKIREKGKACEIYMGCGDATAYAKEKGILKFVSLGSDIKCVDTVSGLALEIEA